MNFQEAKHAFKFKTLAVPALRPVSGYRPTLRPHHHPHATPKPPPPRQRGSLTTHKSIDRLKAKVGQRRVGWVPARVPWRRFLTAPPSKRPPTPDPDHTQPGMLGLLRPRPGPGSGLLRVLFTFVTSDRLNLTRFAELCRALPCPALPCPALP